MIKYMLDTNILIYTIRNRPKKVREAFKKHAEYLTISAVSLGELIFGAEKSAQSARDLADVEALAARLEVAMQQETCHMNQRIAVAGRV